MTENGLSLKPMLKKKVTPDLRPTNSAVAKRRRLTQEERTARTSEAILVAATIMFSKLGIDGARVDEIAKAANLPKNLLYYHFGNKEGLFAAVMERIYRQIRTAQDETSMLELSPEQGIRQLVLRTGQLFSEHPEFERLLQSENLHDGRHVRSSKAIKKMYDPLLSTVKLLLDKGVESGVFREGIDPIDLYISITSLTSYYLGHAFTLGNILNVNLLAPDNVQRRLEHAADMIDRFVRS